MNSRGGLRSEPKRFIKNEFCLCQEPMGCEGGIEGRSESAVNKRILYLPAGGIQTNLSFRRETRLQLSSGTSKRISDRQFGER